MARRTLSEDLIKDLLTILSLGSHSLLMPRKTQAAYHESHKRLAAFALPHVKDARAMPGYAEKLAMLRGNPDG